jgi:transcriptional regulator with XRE-family HTH domain
MVGRASHFVRNVKRACLFVGFPRPWSNWNTRAELAAREQLELELTARRHLVLRDPLIDSLGRGADSTGGSGLATEESNNVVRSHAGDSTLVAAKKQPELHLSPTDNFAVRFKLCPMEFGERLLRARTAAKKTQEQVADACGCSHAAISKAEKGKTETMESDNLFCIADFLGVDARWLATGEGDMQPARSDLDGLSDAQRAAVLSIIKSMK